MSESRRVPRGLETSRQIVAAPVFLPELRKYDADSQLPWWSALGGLSPVYLAEMPNGSRAVSGGAGRFVMEDLPPGSYEVRAVCGGFESPTLGVVVSGGAAGPGPAGPGARRAIRPRSAPLRQLTPERPEGSGAAGRSAAD